MSKPILLLTDTHFTKDNCAIVKEIFLQAFEICRSRGITTCFHLGDVFTERLGHGLNVLVSFLFVLNKAEEMGITLHVIPGNHDKTDLESEASYLDVYAHHPAMVLYRNETFAEIDGKFCALLPYFREDGSYPARLYKMVSEAKLAPKNKTFLFTHIAFDGVKNNDGSKIANNIKTDKIAETFKYAFVGHYHNRSIVGSNIHYIGSPRPKDFGEDNEKGFTILNEKNELEFIKANFRGFKKYKFDLGEIEHIQIYNEAKALVKELNEFHIKLEYLGTEEELLKVDDYVLKNMGFFVEKVNKSIAKSINSAELGEFTKIDSGSTTKLFMEFCKMSSIPKSKIALGLKYLKGECL